MNKLFLDDIKNSNLFRLNKTEYYASVDLYSLNLAQKQTIKNLNHHALDINTVKDAHLYIKSLESYSINNEAIYRDNDQYARFKLIRDLIFKYHTFFYDNSSMTITNDSYDLVAFDYKIHSQERLKKVDNLLSFLLFDKESFSIFGDAQFKEKIKPLIQEALQNSYYHQELHKMFFMSLNNTKLTQFLLDCGLEANYQNQDGLTPLMISSNTGVAKALLNAGAKIETKNTLTLDHTQMLGISRNSKRFKALIHKNAYEMHSILSNNSVLKVFDTQEKTATVVDDLAYSEHFQNEYKMLQSKGTPEMLQKTVRNNNSVILEHLEEFTPLFFKNNHNFVLFCISENKTQWLEKALSCCNKELLVKESRNFSKINSYLEMASYHKSWDSLALLLNLGYYNTEYYNFDGLLSRIYDSKAIQTCYEKIPQAVNFQHILQSTNISLVEQFISEGKQCSDETFNLFCDGIKGNMKQYFGKERLYMSSVKSNIIDCLCVIIQSEKNEALKEQRFEQFTTALADFQYHSDELNKAMKSKIQRALKYFPEKKDIILGKIVSEFPSIVSHYEQKMFNKTVEKATKKVKPTKKDIEESVIEGEQSIKPKRNKI
jgi:hypothetical protein